MLQNNINDQKNINEDIIINSPLEVDAQKNISAPLQDSLVRQKRPISREEKEKIDAYKLSRRSDVRATAFFEHIRARNSLKKFKVDTLPSKTALMGEYKGRPKNLPAEQRTAKTLNKRSRLFKKAANSTMIENAGSGMFEVNYERAAKASFNIATGISKETIRDLSYFMDTDDVQKNKELVGMYAGSSMEEALKLQITEEIDGEEKVVETVNKNQNRVKALDVMTTALLKLDVSKISLEEDEDVAKNAAALEKVSGMVSAYERLLADNPDYMEGLKNPDYKGVVQQADQVKSKNTFDAVTKRVDMLRALSTYYVARKQLITDPYYREHYNEELTMDVGPEANADQVRVAGLLLNVYYAGRNFLKVHGASDRAINKRGRLNLTQNRAAALAQEAAKLENGSREGIEARRKLLMDYRKKSDNAADVLFTELPEQKKQLINQGKTAVLGNSFTLEALDKDYTEPEATKEAVQEAVRQFKELDINGFKFANYKEIFENFDHNMEYTKKADKVQLLVTKALASGAAEFSDEELMQLRAKLMVFSEVRTTLSNMSGLLLKDSTSIADKNFEKWDKYFRDNSARDELAAVPCRDMSKYYQKCLRQITTEHNRRDDTIKKTWRIMAGKAANAKMPKRELEKKRAEYQKNAFIADTMVAEQGKVLTAKGQAGNIAKKYINEHPNEFKDGFKLDQMPRFALDYIAGRSSEDTIRLVKLFGGSDEGELKFWMEFYRDVNSIKPSDYNFTSTKELFNNFSKKTIDQIYLANAKLVGNNITRLAAKLGDDACDVMGIQKDNKEAELAKITRNTQIMYNLGTAYISGRLGGFQSTKSNACRHALSLEDMCGGIDMDAMHDLDVVRNDELVKYGLNDDEVDMIGNIQRELNHIQLGISTRPGERLKQDTDLDQLYKEEAAAYDRKVFADKHKNGIAGELKEYNDAYKDYVKNSDEAKNLAAEFDIKTSRINDEEQKKETIERIEKAFETLLSFDVNDFSFEGYEKLYSKDSVKLRHLSEIGSKASKLYEFYKKQVEADEEELKKPLEEVVTLKTSANKGKKQKNQHKNQQRIVRRTPKVMCTLRETDLSAIKARIDFLATANKYYGGSDNLMDFIKNDCEFIVYSDMQKELEAKRRQGSPDADGSATGVGEMALDKLEVSRYSKEFTLGDNYFNIFKDSKYKNLRDTKLFAKNDNLRASINKLKAVLISNRIPEPGTKDAKTILDGTCNLVGVLYSDIIEKLKDTINEIDAKCSSSMMRAYNENFYKPFRESLEAVSRQCLTDKELFAQKAAEYCEIMSQNKVSGRSLPRWIDVFKFGRAELYDTNKEGVSVKKGGANLSDIFVIQSDKTGKTIYFRREDFAPKENLAEAINDVAKGIYGDLSTDDYKTIRGIINVYYSKDIATFLNLFEQLGNAKQNLGKKSRDLKREIGYPEVALAFARNFISDEAIKKLSPQNNAKELAICTKFKALIERSDKKELEKLGRFFIQIHDMEFKKGICYRDDGCAKIKPGRNLTNRHVATSRMAQLLGVGNMVSDSRTAQVNINGELVKGNLMEDSGGMELYDLRKKYGKKNISYSNEGIKQSLLLQVFDFMTGQVDRHFANFHMIYDEKTKKIIGIKAIDNDMSWGNLREKDVKKDFRCFHALDDDVLKGLPAEFINKIFALDTDNVRILMGDILADDEIADFMERANLVKDRLRQLAARDDNMKLEKSEITVPIYEGEGEKRVKTGEKTVIVSESISYTGDLESEDVRALKAVSALMSKVDKANEGITDENLKTSLHKKSYLNEDHLLSKPEIDAMIDSEIQKWNSQKEAEKAKKAAKANKANGPENN
jgi:hypothetical protein